MGDNVVIWSAIGAGFGILLGMAVGLMFVIAGRLGHVTSLLGQVRDELRRREH